MILRENGVQEIDSQGTVDFTTTFFHRTVDLTVIFERIEHEKVDVDPHGAPITTLSHNSKFSVISSPPVWGIMRSIIALIIRILCRQGADAVR